MVQASDVIRMTNQLTAIIVTMAFAEIYQRLHNLGRVDGENPYLKHLPQKMQRSTKNNHHDEMTNAL